MIRYGTCSWKYDSWRDIVYPREGSFNYLTEYAKFFNTVEIDQWFWSLHPGGKISLPKASDIKSYADSVPDTFRFTIKAPNSITLTHYYAKGNAPLIPNASFLSPELTKKFLELLSGFGKLLGPVMLQFEYLNKKKMPSQDVFLQLLENYFSVLPGGFEFAIEIRNPNYLNNKFFDFCFKHHIHPVFLQGYYMPPVFPVISQFASQILDTAIIRLHGPDREGIEAKSGNVWNKRIEPKDTELHELLKSLFLLFGLEKNVYVNVNNHYEGSAPLTIGKIKQLTYSEGLPF